MLQLILNDNWSMKMGGDDKVYPCSVPMTNFKILLDAQVLPDYNTGVCEKEYLPYARKEYTFFKTFIIDSELLLKDEVVLEFLELDTVTEIYLNDNIIAHTENTHIGYQIEAKRYLNIGENTLKVVFHSPLEYIEERQKTDKMPRNNMGITGVPHIRKPQCHLGWDWGPILPVCGITKNVSLLSYDKVKISDVEIIQKHSLESVTLDFKVDYKILSKTENVNIVIDITSPENKIEKYIFDKNSFSIKINNPSIWSIKELNGLDKQPLYNIKVSLVSSDIILDSTEKTIGLRTIELNRKNDEHGQNFQFIINGIPIFAKGANWIPPDSLIDRVNYDTLKYYIETLKNSNMNMIRVWGGGYYESEEFYNLCDENGILVWQDFAFACAPYPFYNKTFLDNVLNEVTYNVKRLRHRASLALWCGNNEVEAMTMGWRLMKKLVEYTKVFFYDILPTHLKTLDDTTPYVQGSPIGESFLNGMGNDKIGDTHLWGVWHGLQPLNYYRNRFTRFCSEFGLESLPSNDAIEKFAEKKDYSLSSPVFMAHQKCLSGNKKMIYYMATKYNLPNEFIDLPYYTGLIQAECVKDATEHWRRNRGQCNGSLYWQLNDCWLVSSWSSIDYLGKYKALQYQAKHFFNPTMVSIKDDKTMISLYVINDSNSDKDLKLSYSVRDFNGKEVYKGEQDYTALGLSSKGLVMFDLLDFIPKKELKKYFVVANLYENGKLISRKTHLPLPDKQSELPKTNIDTSIEINNDILTVKLKSSVFARSVFVDIKGIYNPFDDNYFDLLPNEEKIIKLSLNELGLDKDYIEKNITIKTVSNIKANKSKFRNFITRFYISVIPMNVINRIIYKFM